MLMRCIRAENRKLRRSPIWLLFLAVRHFRNLRDF